jgi:hypothetical protein
MHYWDKNLLLGGLFVLYDTVRMIREFFVGHWNRKNGNKRKKKQRGIPGLLLVFA